MTRQSFFFPNLLPLVLLSIVFGAAGGDDNPPHPPKANWGIDGGVPLSGDHDDGPPQQEEVLLTVLVEPGRFECFHQPVTKQKHKGLELDYQVIEGGDNRDISFLLKSPKQVIIANDAKQQEGHHRVDIDGPNNGYGDYMFCFDNTFSYTAQKRVFVELFLLDKDGNYLSDYDRGFLASAKNFGNELQMKTFVQATNRVKENLNKVERIQSQHRAQEARDRALMETLNGRVMHWSVLSFLAMMTAAAAQVYTVRSLFMDDSKLGRWLRALNAS